MFPPFFPYCFVTLQPTLKVYLWLLWPRLTNWRSFILRIYQSDTFTAINVPLCWCSIILGLNWKFWGGICVAVTTSLLSPSGATSEESRFFRFTQSLEDDDRQPPAETVRHKLLSVCDVYFFFKLAELSAACFGIV